MNTHKNKNDTAGLGLTGFSETYFIVPLGIKTAFLARSFFIGNNSRAH